MCLFFDGSHPTPSLHAYADSNLVNAPPFRSTTGYIVKTHGGVVAWKSGRQATATDSTMAAEIQAVTTTLKEVLFCRYLLRQLQEHLPHLPILSAEPTVIFNDNAGAVRHSNDHVNSSKSKHIDRQQHFTMDYVKSKQVAVVHVGTKDNLADGFTTIEVAQGGERLQSRASRVSGLAPKRGGERRGTTRKRERAARG